MGPPKRHLETRVAGLVLTFGTDIVESKGLIGVSVLKKIRDLPYHESVALNDGPWRLHDNVRRIGVSLSGTLYSFLTNEIGDKPTELQGEDLSIIIARGN